MARFGGGNMQADGGSSGAVQRPMGLDPYSTQARKGIKYQNPQGKGCHAPKPEYRHPVLIKFMERSLQNISHLIFQKYWLQETRHWYIYQNIGATYTVRGTCACTTSWKNEWTWIARYTTHRQNNWIHSMKQIYAHRWHRVWTTFGGMVQQTFRCQIQYEASTRGITDGNTVEIPNDAM